MPPDGQNFPTAKPQLMLSEPGIQRDGTMFSSTGYMAGEWCRFYQKRPRKMQGCRELHRDVGGIVRGMDVESYDGYSWVHLGSQNVLQRYTINLRTGLPSGLVDRTPAGLVLSPDNNWQFALVYNTANNSNLLLAHAAPNIQDISDTQERLVYFSEVRDPNAFLPITGSEVSGGVVAMWPYFLRYGNDGEVSWNVPGNITDLTGTGSGSARPWGTKIVRGLPVRGNGTGPATLLWSLDALIRCQFTGGTRIFDFDTLTTSSALLSSNGIIEHAGIYYWATVSGFSMFNGVIKDMGNETNRQFLLQNLNWNMRQKVFAMKMPRWHEIWWCAPLFGSTECNWAFIYNYLSGAWYDTPLNVSGGGFSAGVYEQIYHYPIVSSPEINKDTGGTSSWQHDVGLDEVSGSPAVPKAIRSWYRTHEFNLVRPAQPGQNGQNQTMSFSLIEPDFKQRGDLQIYLLSRANARANTRRKGPMIVPAVPSGAEQIAKTKFTGRLTSFVVLSNQLGGHYEAGSPLFHWQPADARTEDGGAQPTELDTEFPIFPDPLPRSEVPA
jgi:hypothetical protein